MGLFSKSKDPLAERSKQVKRQLAELEAQIQALNRQSSAPAAVPERPVRYSNSSRTMPQPVPVQVPTAAPFPTRVELETPHPMPSPERLTDAHFNDLGVRKFDLVAAWSRVWKHLAGPPSTNPHLVNFMAAKSLQGVRPLRFERRVARNRFFAFFVLMLFLLYGLLYFFFRGH